MDDKKLYVLKCGLKVKFKEIELTGIITSIKIENDNVFYEVSYWSNGENQVRLFSDYEFVIIDKEPSVAVEIGFNNA